jgi:hypothetical protein
LQFIAHTAPLHKGGFSFDIGRIILLYWITAFFGRPAWAQHLEAVLASTSLNSTQTKATSAAIPIGPIYTLLTDVDRNRYDDIGYRLTLAARWRVGNGGFFAQPEAAFTATRGQSYIIRYYRTPQFPDGDTFSHRIRRWELAGLLGYHTSRRTYILVGPVLAFNQQQAQLAALPGSVAAVYNSLFQTVEPVQVLVQAGAGLTVGRFDLSLRLEQSLTPYSRRGTFEGATYGYEQHIRQGLFTAGFLIYKQQVPKLLPAQWLRLCPSYILT